MAGNPQSHRILMLGASGKLGRMMRAIGGDLAAQGYEIIPVFRRESDAEGILWGPGMACPTLTCIDSIWALWGVTGRDSEQLLQNATLAQEAMALGEALGVRRVLHCSSAAVYLPGPDPLNEASSTCAPSPYGLAKREMEHKIQAASPMAEQVILRIGNVAGAESLFGNMRPGGQIRLDRFADGQGPWRSYITPQALLRVMLRLSDGATPAGLYNVAAPAPVSMQALAEAAGCGVIWQPAPSGALPKVVLDTTRLQQVCPLGPEESDPAQMVAGARATGIWP